MSTNHKISRLTFEITYPLSQKEATQQQKHLEKMSQQEIPEMLEHIFNTIPDIDKRSLVLDQLEIDLEEIDFVNFKAVFLEKIKKTVKEKLTELQRKNSDSKEMVKSYQDHDLVLFLLRNGHLPWWADHLNSTSVRGIINNTALLEDNEFVQRLFTELNNDASIVRFIRYFKGTPHVLFLEKQLPKNFISGEIMSFIQQLAPEKSELLYSSLIRLTSSTKPQHLLAYSIRFVHLLLNNSPYTMATIFEKKLVSISSLPFSKEETDRFYAAIQQPDYIREIEDDNDTPELNEDDFTHNSMVSKAGLILLLPFLRTFFEATGLVSENTFRSKTDQHYAVYLLNFLATGEDTLPDEHSLLMEKLLCGMDLNEVLLPFNRLRKGHAEECEFLLQTVIERWKALKSSSPQTIQKSFLSRSGFLSRQADGTWRLFIERETIDLLLDKLPWTISISRIPWTTEMIYTEW